MSSRTFKLDSPLMHGSDIKEWQRWLKKQLASWGVDYPLKIDGIYAQITRDATATVVHGLGLSSASAAMKKGVTPTLRTKLRNKDQTPAEKKRYRERAGWRRDLKARFSHSDVASPLSTIISSAWGYHPGLHDGVDLICKASAPILAICKAKVVRVSDDWWGLGSPGGALADRGDGIVIIRSLVNDGPFSKGLNFCYGHAEHPAVRVDQIVEAGAVLGHAGFANAWHVHFMVNSRRDTKGVGDRDPMKFVNFARSHA